MSRKARVPKNHPLRHIHTLFDHVLDGLYGESERLLTEHLTTICCSAGSSAWSRSPGLAVDGTFHMNRDRLVSDAVTQRLLHQPTEFPKIRRLLSDEHFSIDGTLIEV